MLRGYAVISDEIIIVPPFTCGAKTNFAWDLVGQRSGQTHGRAGLYTEEHFPVPCCPSDRIHCHVFRKTQLTQSSQSRWLDDKALANKLPNFNKEVFYTVFFIV